MKISDTRTRLTIPSPRTRPLATTPPRTRRICFTQFHTQEAVLQGGLLRPVGMRGGRAGERAPPALPLLLALLLALAAPGPRPAAGFAVHACKKKSVRAPPPPASSSTWPISLVNSGGGRARPAATVLPLLPPARPPARDRHEPAG